MGDKTMDDDNDQVWLEDCATSHLIAQGREPDATEVAAYCEAFRHAHKALEKLLDADPDHAAVIRAGFRLAAMEETDWPR